MLDSLHTKEPRERDGARTASRFEFQANFSILKILDLHETGADYRAIFDHFDDLTILDSSSNPTQIEFYQIKGRSSGSWTIKQLAKQDKDKKPPRSIIGKMYKSASDFADKTKSITFVSNEPFKFTLSSGTNSDENNVKIKASDLDNTEIQIIEAALDADFPSPRSPNCAGILLFERTNLPLQDQAIFVTGRLVTHLETYAAAESFAVKALYDVLYQNVIAKTGSTEKFDSADALNKGKSLTRLEISSLMKRAISKQQFENGWPLILTELNAAGFNTPAIIKAHTSAIKYLRDRARGERNATSFSQQAEANIEKDQSTFATCGTVLEAALILQLKIMGSSDQNDCARLGPLLVEAYEAMNGQAS